VELSDYDYDYELDMYAMYFNIWVDWVFNFYTRAKEILNSGYIFISIEKKFNNAKFFRGGKR